MGVPSFSGRGGGGQDRARGRHLTAMYTLSAFSRFNQLGGGGGGGVLSAFVRFNQWGGGGGGGCCPLSASGGAHVCKQGGGAPFSPEGGGHGPPPGDAHGCSIYLQMLLTIQPELAPIENLLTCLRL